MSTTLDREQRKLKCKLTDLELRARGDAMAEAELSIDERKEVRRGINGEIAALSTKRNELATVIEERAEMRMVDCAWVEDAVKPFEHLVRQDTGEQVETRPLDPQIELPLGKVLDEDSGEVLDAPPAAEPDAARQILTLAERVLAAPAAEPDPLDDFEDVIDELAGDDEDEAEGEAGPAPAAAAREPAPVAQGPAKKRNGHSPTNGKRAAVRRAATPPTAKGKAKGKTARTLHA